MSSTFMGLETSKRGLSAQQSALYTVGHNISNANTEGYSRQRVNLQPTQGFPGIGTNAPKMPGFLGTGVEAGSVERVRDKFVDNQFRQETNKLGYWQSKSEVITQVEDILNEPSDYGLAQTLNEFWNSLQDLSVNPEDGGARKVVAQRGVAVADSFNYISKSLSQVQANVGNEIDISLKDVNSILEQVANLNKQIKDVETNGYLPNDLYDSRDTLIDQLSTYIPVNLQYTPSGGNALASAEGSVTISMNGGSINLVDGQSYEQIGQGEIQNINSGKLKSLVKSHDTYLPAMLDNLNKMAKAFAEEFNKMHKTGSDLSGNQGDDFFVSSSGTLDASNIKVSQSIIDHPDKIAAADIVPKDTETETEQGNGKLALQLANMKFTGLTDLGGVSTQTYFEGLIGQLGVDGQQASRLQYNSETLLQSVTERRASISSVSLDEEMTNMISYQKAYNASARMITAIDETLDKIINGMGRVGL